MDDYRWYSPEELQAESFANGVSQGHAGGVADATRTLSHPIFHHALREGTERLLEAVLGGREVQGFVRSAVEGALSRATPELRLESRHDQYTMMTVQTVRMEPFVYSYTTEIHRGDLEGYRVAVSRRE